MGTRPRACEEVLGREGRSARAALLGRGRWPTQISWATESLPRPYVRDMQERYLSARVVAGSYSGASVRPGLNLRETRQHQEDRAVPALFVVVELAPNLVQGMRATRRAQPQTVSAPVAVSR
jgi:hypothetical protein